MDTLTLDALSFPLLSFSSLARCGPSQRHDSQAPLIHRLPCLPHLPHCVTNAVLLKRGGLSHGEGLLEHTSQDPAPGVPDSAGLGWGPGICISTRFLGDAEAAGPGPHCESHHLQGSRCAGAEVLRATLDPRLLIFSVLGR